MAELTGKLNLNDVVDGYREMRRLATRARLFFQQLAKSGRKDVKEHQKERRGERQAWPSRAQSTQERARRQSNPRRSKGPRQRLLGNIPRAWKTFASDTAMRMIHRSPWAAVHDQGGTAGHGAVQPQRQFSYWSRDFLQSTPRQYRAFVRRGWN